MWKKVTFIDRKGQNFSIYAPVNLQIEEILMILCMVIVFGIGADE